MAFQCIRCKAEIDRAFKACPHCGEPVTEFLRRYADQPVDGKYQIVERLGAGGMGEVYKVTHTFLGATRVIKVIRPQISESQDAHDRFLREARAATKVHHPSVATLHDFSALPDGSHYMVWEFIDGENLAQRIRQRGVLPPRYAVQLTIQALHGLEAIHRAGIVHRDISPENLMITREGGGEEHVKIIDMGVAKVEGSTDNATRVGVFVGKLRYASPEHLGFLQEGEHIDARADLYSMGMVLYEMLTGRPPFEATSPHEYVMLHSRDAQFKPLNLPGDLPGGAQLQAVLAHALERDRNKRFATARDFAVALEEVERTLPDPAAMRTVDMRAPEAVETIRTPLPPMQRDTMHRSTVRTDMRDAGATVRTPLPGDVNIRREPGSNRGLLVVGAVIIAALGVIIFLLMRKPGDVARTETSAPAATAKPKSQPPAGSEINVVTPTPLQVSTQEPAKPPLLAENKTTTSAPTLATKIPTPSVVTKRPEPAPATTTEPPPQPKPAVEVTTVRTYVEGGDSDANDALAAELKRQMEGVTRVAIRGSGPLAKDLTNRLKEEVPSLTIADSAETVVDFNGVIERRGFGRKRRSAQATVTKNGRLVFRYEMPAQEYRVGDTPAEAFARILADAFH